MRKENIGDATLYLGDCMEFMVSLGDSEVDIVLTDPPYGMKRFQKPLGKNSRFSGYGYEESGIHWDKKPGSDCFEEIFRVSRNRIIWGSNNFMLPASEYFFIWDKAQSVDNFACAELAYTDINMPAKIFRYPIHLHNKTTKFHPTQKPVPLMSWCLGFCKDAKVVLDPFMGSGTTGVACMELGRKFIGIEKEEKYFDIACKRIDMAERQGKLF